MRNYGPGNYAAWKTWELVYGGKSDWFLPSEDELNEAHRFLFTAVPSINDIRRSFYYVFDGATRQGGGVPEIDAHDIDGPFTVGGVRVVPVPVWHGRMPVLGFRFPVEHERDAQFCGETWRKVLLPEDERLERV